MTVVVAHEGAFPFSFPGTRGAVNSISPVKCAFVGVAARSGIASICFGCEVDDGDGDGDGRGRGRGEGAGAGAGAGAGEGAGAGAGADAGAPARAREGGRTCRRNRRSW